MVDRFFWVVEILIVILSIILNWGVQLSYYLWRKHQNKRSFAGQKTLLEYYTGYIGDGVIVPIINVLIYFIIVNISKIREIGVIRGIGGIRGLFLALVVGLMVDILAHYLQGRLKLTNWSMPRPFKWNFAGRWHMVSFPIQIGYLALFLGVTAANLKLVLTSGNILLATSAVLSLMLLFCFLYGKDNRWI